MKRMINYLCDNRTPSKEEVMECIDIANAEDVVVELKWFFPYNGWHSVIIRKGDTYEEINSRLPKVYGV